jgi:hypothetical protein
MGVARSREGELFEEQRADVAEFGGRVADDGEQQS